uniref:Mechanosensory abnormality protein 6 (inferred by orthology to a C. elegans protein) n=1 Tax=Strongyloides venezuelensis TaxID=75913 RepID=A0A0K0FUX7_STRVS
MGKYKIFKKKEKDERKEENIIGNRKARRDVFDDKKGIETTEKENTINNVSKTIKLNKTSLSNISIFEKLIITSIVTVFTSWLIKWILILDTNQNIHPHHPSSCYKPSFKEPLSGVVTVDEIEMILYFTQIGKVYGVEFERKDVINELATDWKTETDIVLNIKSISYYGVNFNIFFYLINEKEKADEIIVFVWEQKYSRLIFNSRYYIPTIPRISSLSPVAFNRLYLISSFYFTNNKFLQAVEIFTNLKYGSIHFYDGKNAIKVADGLSYPKDITIDTKRNRLFVGQIIERTIKAYHIRPDFSLEEASDINTILSSPKKLFVDKKSGDIWTLSYLHLWKKLYNDFIPIYSNKTTYNGQTKVHRIRFQDDMMKTWIATEPFADDGEYFSFANDLSLHDDQLILTSKTNGLLYCPKLNMKII